MNSVLHELPEDQWAVRTQEEQDAFEAQVNSIQWAKFNLTPEQGKHLLSLEHPTPEQAATIRKLSDAMYDVADNFWANYELLNQQAWQLHNKSAALKMVAMNLRKNLPASGLARMFGDEPIPFSF